MLPLTCTEPFTPLDAWIREAISGGDAVPDRYFAEGALPDAMQVATVGPDGRPSLRTVLLKAWGPDGLVFYTNLGSRKAQHLAGDARVALLMHWAVLQRQIIAEAVAEPVTDAEADAYWASRPRGSQIGGWASLQSQPLGTREELEARVAEVEARFAGVPVPRPPFWSGFRCRPDRVEFWQGRRDRLHERCVFTRAHDGSWARVMLYP